jgi:hypothetical protein
MSTPREDGQAPPEGMRDYRVEAKLRPSPDLHRLARLFTGMALARTQAEQHGDSGSGQNPGGPVESET